MKDAPELGLSGDPGFIARASGFATKHAKNLGIFAKLWTLPDIRRFARSRLCRAALHPPEHENTFHLLVFASGEKRGKNFFSCSTSLQRTLYAFSARSCEWIGSMLQDQMCSCDGAFRRSTFHDPRTTTRNKNREKRRNFCETLDPSSCQAFCAIAAVPGGFAPPGTRESGPYLGFRVR